MTGFYRGVNLSHFRSVINAHGFTLIELIISTAVAVLVGGLLIGILVNNTGLFYKQSSKISEGVGINDALSSIRFAVKQSSAVSSGYPVTSPTFTSSSSELVLKVPSIDSSENIINDTFDYYVFTVLEQRLYLKVFPDPISTRKSVDTILSQNVNSLEFTYLDALGNPITPVSAVKVKINLVLSQKVGATDEVTTLQTEANLRND